MSFDTFKIPTLTTITIIWPKPKFKPPAFQILSLRGIDSTDRYSQNDVGRHWSLFGHYDAV